MTASEPLTVLRQTVPAGYTDYNQHMADGYYLVVFSDATTGLMDHIGLGPAAREATGHTLFTLEVHANYLKEVKRGAEVRVDCQILGYDQEAPAPLPHHAYLGDAPDAVATTEQMQANDHMKAGRTAPFLPEVLAKIEAFQRRQAVMPRPAYASGRVIGFAAEEGLIAGESTKRP